MLNPDQIQTLPTNRQAGASLITVLVAMLLLSLGMLALGAMLSFAVQMPKLSGYRANAVNLASGYIERIRANPKGLQWPLQHTEQLRHRLVCQNIIICAYPDCNSSSLATMDFDQAKAGSAHANCRQAIFS